MFGRARPRRAGEPSRRQALPLLRGPQCSEMTPATDRAGAMVRAEWTAPSARGSRAGMAFRARQWVETEFETLGRLWAAGASVPYPVQRLGREVMVEYVGSEEAAAPRLVQFRGTPSELRDLYKQLLDNLRLMAGQGVVHGDLSPYNMLVWEGRLVLIDFPQAVDPFLNSEGMSLLERDVLNTCSWFAKHGVATDTSALIAELIGASLGPRPRK